MKKYLYLIIATSICLLFARSVWADRQENDKVMTTTENTISTKPTKRWLLNSNNKSQRYIPMQGETRDERAQELLIAYWHPAEYWDTFIHVARVYEVYPEVLLCVTYADSSVGTQLKTKWNWGNVWNNDRGDKVWFANLEQGINAIGRVLNNQYLWSKNTIWEFSPYSGGTAPFYATSPENWEINVLNCMGMIHNKKITGDFQIRR